MQVACNQRGKNASQQNIGGTGLGSFNDRFRDALMGGSPFASPRYQGFVTGLHTQPNSFTQVQPQQLWHLNELSTTDVKLAAPHTAKAESRVSMVEVIMVY